MRCEQCGSRDLNYERDALLVASALRIEGAVLVLDAAPRPAPLDDVVLSCLRCGRECEGARWEDWRPEHAPAAEVVVEAEDAMDLIADYLNERTAVQGSDFLEFVCELLPRTGRQVVRADA